MIETIYESFGKIIISYSVVVFIAYGLFRFLGKKWIESKFATQLEEYKAKQNKELEDFKYKIKSLFNVLPEAWVKLHDAKDDLSALVSPLEISPPFSQLDDVKIRNVLESNYKWKDAEIDELVNASDKNEYFRHIMLRQRSNDTQRKIMDFHRYIIRNSIFMSQELKEKFSEADDLMWHVFFTKKAGEESRDYSLMMKSFEELSGNINNICDSIEELVQKRLRYDEAL